MWSDCSELVLRAPVSLTSDIQSTNGLSCMLSALQGLEAEIERLQQEIPEDQAQAEKTTAELQKQDQVGCWHQWGLLLCCELWAVQAPAAA